MEEDIEKGAKRNVFCFSFSLHHHQISSFFFIFPLVPDLFFFFFPCLSSFPIHHLLLQSHRAGAAPWRTRTSPTSPPLRPRASLASLTGTGEGDFFSFSFVSFVLSFSLLRLSRSLHPFPSSSLQNHLLLLLPLLPSEVAKFCQKYLASRVRAHDGFASKRDVPGALADCFHEIDAMLASDRHAAELEAMRAPPAPPLHLVKFGSEEVEAGEVEEATKKAEREERRPAAEAAARR